MKNLKSHQKVLLFLVPTLFAGACVFLLFVSCHYASHQYFRLYLKIAITMLVLSGIGAIYMHIVLDKLCGNTCPWITTEDWEISSEEELEEIKKLIETMPEKEEQDKNDMNPRRKTY